MYEFNRVLLGLNSSPFIAQYVMQQHAKRFSEEFPLASDAVFKFAYMDNSMGSVDTEEKDIGLCRELMKLWKLANMHTKKRMSNLLTVAQHIPIDERASCRSFDGGEILPCVKSL